MFKKLLYILIVLLVGFFSYSYIHSQKETPNLDGGLCKYVEYSGSCMITGISKDSEEKNGYIGSEITYFFDLENQTDTAKMLIPYSKDIANGKKMKLTYMNGWNVGDKFIKKYSLKVNSTYPYTTYPCVLKEITAGTCTPTLVEFTSIDTADYVDLK